MTDVNVDIQELPVGRSRLIDQDGRRFLLCRSTTGVHATIAICPHQLKSMEGARVFGETIMCPHHGARFRLDDGTSLAFQLTARALDVYPVALDGTSATVTLPD